MTPIDNMFDTDFGFIIKQPHSGRKVADKSPIQTPHLFEATEDPNHSPPPQQETPQQKSIENEYIVSQVFYPLILVSKYAGFCPVKITRKSEGTPSIIYSFKWLSLQFWGTFLWGILWGMVLTVWIINVIFQIPWPFQL